MNTPPDFVARLIGLYNDAALSLMISIGHKTGLLDVMGKLPPLTTVRQAIRVLGESSGAAMLQLLQNQRPNISLPPVELIVRESSVVHPVR